MYASCQTEEDCNQIIRIFQLRVKTHTGSLLSAMELPWLNKKSVIRFAIEEPDDLYHYKTPVCPEGVIDGCNFTKEKRQECYMAK